MANETTLKVPAIHCESCVKTIERALGTLPSLEIAEADPETKLVRIQYDETIVTLDQIREALDEVGFSPD